MSTLTLQWSRCCSNFVFVLTKRHVICVLRKRIHVPVRSGTNFHSLVCSHTIHSQQETVIKLSLGIMGKSQSRSYNITTDQSVQSKRYSRKSDIDIGKGISTSAQHNSSNQQNGTKAPQSENPKVVEGPSQSSATDSVFTPEEPLDQVEKTSTNSDREIEEPAPESSSLEVERPDTNQVENPESSDVEKPVTEEAEDSYKSEPQTNEASVADRTSNPPEILIQPPEEFSSEEEFETKVSTAQDSSSENLSTANLVLSSEESQAEDTPEEQESALEGKDPEEEVHSDKAELKEESSSEEDIPLTEDTPTKEEIVSEEDIPITEEPPLNEENITEEDIPLAEESTVNEETVSKEDIPLTEVTPTNEDILPETEADTMPLVEQVVCSSDDMKDGEMRECDVGDGKVLLVKDDGKFYAVSSKCTHYGAPLSKGVYCNGRVRCPWHGACFNVKTGDIEDFPGLDSLQKFKVEESDGKVTIKADKEALANSKRQKDMCKCVDADKTVLIIGGGPASVVCAETLRQEGFTGKITIATKESHLPYDRIKLSKMMSTAASDIALRNETFYKDNDIEILTGREATGVDTDNNTVTFTGDSKLKYDSLVIATGGQPRVIPIPGADLQNVCMLRTPEDANTIASNAVGKKVVIIGSSFIGMEVAAFLAENKAESVSVVDLIKVPFQLTLGDKVGSALQKMHEEHGVKFYFEKGIKSFAGENDKVTKAILSDGTELEADLCVLGIGVVPATKFLEGSGLSMNKFGYLPVNKNMETDKPGVYAAGDIVNFPLFTCSDQEVNIQHWQMAHAHGRNVAMNIVGKKTEIKSVPYFWTVMYKKSVRYTGYGPGYDDVVFHGDDSKFVAFYTKGDDVVAVASLNYDPIVSQAAEFMAAGKKISKSEITETPDSWTSRL